MSYSFVDCQGYAGGFACGATQAGLRLVGKREAKGAFGTPLMEANRVFLGDDWEAQDSAPDEWEPVAADVVIGNPPCSAFSGMTAGLAVHGMDSPINNCMWDLVRYAAKVKPQVMCMESVSQAFSRGLPLMRDLGKHLSEATGLSYSVTHVLQNNWSVGGCTKRKRYFLVLSQVPFGMERYDLKRLPVLEDAFRDLVDQPLAVEPTPYASAPTWWSEDMRAASGVVDGHYDPTRGPYRDRIYGMMRGDKAVEWRSGEGDTDMLRRYYQTHGELPSTWHYVSPGRTTTRVEQMVERDFHMGGFSKPKFWPWDQPGRVINGSGPYQVWHPNGRFATHRELARLLGFPDDWVVGSAAGAKDLNAFWGKGTSVSPARWLMQWVKASLDGNPGSYVGEELDGDHGDRLIDVSMDWRVPFKAGLVGAEAA